MAKKWRIPLQATDSGNVETLMLHGVSLTMAKHARKHITWDVPAPRVFPRAPRIPDRNRVLQARLCVPKNGGPDRLLLQVDEISRGRTSVSSSIHHRIAPTFSPSSTSGRTAKETSRHRSKNRSLRQVAEKFREGFCVRWTEDADDLRPVSRVQSSH